MILSLLLSLDTPSDVDIDTGRSRESECSCDFREIERGDVEDGFEGVGSVGLDVGSETVFRRLVEVVVLRNKFLELSNASRKTVSVTEVVGRKR